MAAEGQTDKMAPGMAVWMKKKCIITFLRAEKMAPMDVHRHLLNVDGDLRVDMSTLRRWVVHFSSDNSDTGVASASTGFYKHSMEAFVHC